MCAPIPGGRDLDFHDHIRLLGVLLFILVERWFFPQGRDPLIYDGGGGGPKVKGYLFWEFCMALGYHKLVYFLGCEFENFVPRPFFIYLK